MQCACQHTTAYGWAGRPGRTPSQVTTRAQRISLSNALSSCATESCSTESACLQACKLRSTYARHSSLAGKPLRHITKHMPHTSRNRGPLRATAMINVDGSPPLFLGAGMVVAGLILYQLRNSRPYITKDFDIVLSCIAIFAGGILIFQVHHHHLSTIMTAQTTSCCFVC